MLTDERPALQPWTEVIALPPLKMILVHAKDERENSPIDVVETVEPKEQTTLQPEALKKLIAHLEQTV